ncbi:hypothetical protein [Curtobacterium ammoniigenes]|uniref:hypothetical protein n=1 Tax=Curtobacterium ammoniigenes TaxID=395387 RepID=UPI0008371D4C|nr:hypothetical protein [Curtobacterium ammoniigenes]
MKRATITPVITVGAMVTSNTSYTVTAPLAGTLIRHGDGRAHITSPEGSTVSIETQPDAAISEWAVPSGTTVPRGLPIATAEYVGFTLHAALSPQQTLAVRGGVDHARAEIDGAGSPFECSLLDPRPTVEDGGTAALYCTVPAETEPINGLEGLVALHLPPARNVLSLPVEAVAGSVRNGSVFRMGSGSATETPVELGVSDGVRVEIRSELRDGDRVRIPSPSLRHG